MPRSASEGGSSRRATRFNAPRGSPRASARAAAVISESIEIPPHLSLPPFDYAGLLYLTTINQHVVSRTNDEGDQNDDAQDRDTRGVARRTGGAPRGGEGAHQEERGNGAGGGGGAGG